MCYFLTLQVIVWTSLLAQMVKSLPATQKTWVRFLGWEDPLEKGMATHSSILAWRIPWTEEPGGLQSMDSQRVRHDWATFTGHFWAGFSKNCSRNDHSQNLQEVGFSVLLLTEDYRWRGEVAQWRAQGAGEPRELVWAVKDEEAGGWKAQGVRESLED